VYRPLFVLLCVIVIGFQQTARPQDINSVQVLDNGFLAQCVGRWGIAVLSRVGCFTAPQEFQSMCSQALGGLLDGRPAAVQCLDRWYDASRDLPKTAEGCCICAPPSGPSGCACIYLSCASPSLTCMWHVGRCSSLWVGWWAPHSPAEAPRVLLVPWWMISVGCIGA
jgi:hypothetical protein